MDLSLVGPASPDVRHSRTYGLQNIRSDLFLDLLQQFALLGRDLRAEVFGFPFVGICLKIASEEYNRAMSETNTNAMRAQEVLAFSLRTMRGMIENMCKELTPQEMLHRPCPEANCAA